MADDVNKPDRPSVPDKYQDSLVRTAALISVLKTRAEAQTKMYELHLMDKGRDTRLDESKRASAMHAWEEIRQICSQAAQDVLYDHIELGELPEVVNKWRDIMTQ